MFYQLVILPRIFETPCIMKKKRTTGLIHIIYYHFEVLERNNCTESEFSTVTPRPTATGGVISQLRVNFTLPQGRCPFWRSIIKKGWKRHKKQFASSLYFLNTTQYKHLKPPKCCMWGFLFVLPLFSCIGRVVLVDWSVCLITLLKVRLRTICV